ncbi:MAG: DUF1294 domain-containing protein [Defluviitaleaceae bacterium]|nr:DUF1294 domain-containing protein [Defluviitaleaceae bacterium]
MNYVLLVFGAAVVVMNIVTFGLYAIDKRRAIKKEWRISEATLILCAFLMGGIGAALGMRIIRHKTDKPKFKILVPVAVVLNLVLIYAVLHFSGWLPWA